MAHVNIPNKAMHSLVNADLKLVLHTAKEGVGICHGIKIYEGLVTFEQVNDHFQIEENSDTISEQYKMQRDITHKRINGLAEYFEKRQDTLLPSMIVFVSKIDIEKTHTIGTHEIIEGTLRKSSDRFVLDGQARTSFIKQYLSQLKSNNQHGKYLQVSAYTVNVKFIETNTDLVSEKSHLIRQVFSDLHGNVTTPTSSLNLYFDSSTRLSQLLKDVLTAELDDGSTIIDKIALNGEIKIGQVWNLAQFSDFIKLLIGCSTREINQFLDEEIAVYTKLSKAFTTELFNQLPLSILTGEDYKLQHKDAAFTKALFAKGFAYLGNSLIEQSMVSGTSINFDCIKLLNECVNLSNLNDKDWKKVGITSDRLNANNVKTTVINKGCQKIIGRYLCNTLKVFPSSLLI